MCVRACAVVVMMSYDVESEIRKKKKVRRAMLRCYGEGVLVGDSKNVQCSVKRDAFVTNPHSHLLIFPGISLHECTPTPRLRSRHGQHHTQPSPTNPEPPRPHAFAQLPLPAPAGCSVGSGVGARGETGAVPLPRAACAARGRAWRLTPRVKAEGREEGWRGAE